MLTRLRASWRDLVAKTAERYDNYRRRSRYAADALKRYRENPTAANKRAYKRARKIKYAYLRTFRISQTKRDAAHVALKKAKTQTARENAISYSRSLLGAREMPAGSNRGGRITGWQNSFGSWLIGQPWCGVFVGVILRHVGVDVTSRVAAVSLIVQDAKAGRNGFRAWKSGPGSGSPGDAVVLFGPTVHVGFVIRHDKKHGGYVTREGNTSAGAGGSQSNGGGSYQRFRPYSQVYGFAVPDYKN